MQTRQLRAAVTATIAGSVYFDMPAASRIRSIILSIVPTASAADLDYILAEVSLSSSQQTQVNDAQGVLAVHGVSFDFTTSGAAWGGQTHQQLCDYAVARGQRVYLNCLESGGGTYDVRALIAFD